MRHSSIALIARRCARLSPSAWVCRYCGPQWRKMSATSSAALIARFRSMWAQAVRAGWARDAAADRRDWRWRTRCWSPVLSTVPSSKGCDGPSVAGSCARRCRPRAGGSRRRVAYLPSDISDTMYPSGLCRVTRLNFDDRQQRLGRKANVPTRLPDIIWRSLKTVQEVEELVCRLEASCLAASRSCLLKGLFLYR